MRKILIIIVGLCAALIVSNTPGRAESLSALTVMTVTIDGPDGRPVDVMVAIPKAQLIEGAKFVELPTVIALHGQAAVSTTGRTFFDRYQVLAAYNALKKQQVGDAQYMGWSDAAHNRFLQASLTAEPLADLAIVAPPVPNFLVERPQVSVSEYVKWLASSMLPQLRERFAGLARDRSLTAIAGVSMGATLALRAGFRYPELFGAVSAVEPALRGEALQIADEAKHTTRSQYIQLVMPMQDEYGVEVQRFSHALREAQVPHSFVSLPGEHGERFAAGAGSMEILRFAGSVLSARAPRI